MGFTRVLGRLARELQPALSWALACGLLAAAAQKPPIQQLHVPHLKAIFPLVSGYDEYRDRFYSRGGAFKLGHRLEWMAENMRASGYVQDFSKYVLHLPLRTSDIAALGWISPLYRNVMDHPAFDGFWRE